MQSCATSSCERPPRGPYAKLCLECRLEGCRANGGNSDGNTKVGETKVAAGRLSAGNKVKGNSEVEAGRSSAGPLLHYASLEDRCGFIVVSNLGLARSLGAI